jgi:hypothetical protein
LSTIEVFWIEKKIDLFALLITGSSQNILGVAVLKNKIPERVLVRRISFDQEIL